MSSAVRTEPHSDTPVTQPRRRGGLLGALTGTTFEVFDWAIYTTFAAFFATAFFGPDGTKEGTGAFLNTLIVFAVGFVARPVGSLVFGHLSDTRGRRISLYATSATALLGTTLIALAPTHSQIGWGAAVVLVAARTIQGLAHGGEQPAAGAYISEIAQPHRRGLWSSLIYVAILFGGLLGTLLGALLSSLLSPAELSAWGWRIAFGVGALGSIVALYLVWRLPETETFEKAHATQRPDLLQEMLRAWRPALMIIGLTLGITIAFQNWAAMTGYHIAVFKAKPADTFWASAGANLIAMVSLPLWGALSDRVGRKPVLLVSFVGVAATTYLLMNYLDGSPTRMFIAMTASLVMLAGPLAIIPALMAELVPTSIRTIGVGFSYALATAIFGGTVPPLQTWISRTWGPEAFGLYVTAAVVVSLLVALTVPETRGKNLDADATTADLDPAQGATR